MTHAEKAETTSSATPARGPVRTALTAALDYLSGAMVKMIPVLLVCGMFKTVQTLIGLAVGGFVGGIWAGATHVTAYIMGSSSFLSILGYVGGGALNTLNAGISDLLAMGVAAAVTYATWRDANAPSRG
jgi:hypothetical protein